jgi:FKBP-type peptidyl-prolyl cis-trans isomerase FklB
MDLNKESSKVSYALGMSVANNLKSARVADLDMDVFVAALKASYNGENTEFTAEEANNVLQQYFAKVQEAESAKTIEAGKNFLEENKAKDGVVTLESGLQYKVITEGTGDKPKETDQVKCHYHGTLIDGTVFDSSVQRNQPATFPVNGVIKGWVEALQLMPVGSKWELCIPSDLAYGAQGAGQAIGPHTTLIFEVELLEIV